MLKTVKKPQQKQNVKNTFIDIKINILFIKKNV